MPTSAARNSAALGRILLGDDPFQILIQAAHQPDQRLDFIIAEAGQLALRRAGLYENFLKIARYEDQGRRLYDKDGTLIFADDDADESDRPEVDRTALRQMLLASLPAEMIRWDHGLHTARPLDNGTYELVLESGIAGPFDLVVGADGSWSRVRPLVSSYRPQYSGITFIEFGIDDVDKSHPELAALVGHGKIGVEADGRGLIVQRNGNAHLRSYAIFRVPTEWAERTFDFASPAKARARLAAKFEGWAPNILGLIEAGNDYIVPRPNLPASFLKTKTGKSPSKPMRRKCSIVSSSRPSMLRKPSPQNSPISERNSPFSIARRISTPVFRARLPSITQKRSGPKWPASEIVAYCTGAAAQLPLRTPSRRCGSDLTPASRSSAGSSPSGRS